MLNFYKYQSLGNDFILLDWLTHSGSINPGWIKRNCNRQNGIGADGVLILQNKSRPQVQMFNADGTDGQSCFNGLRCAAYYLVNKRNFPQKFKLKMQRLIDCEVIKNIVTINVGKVNYQRSHQIQIADKILSGHIVDVGNPHFVVLEKVDLAWLQKHGSEIENHQDFPNRTNVEFVWGHKFRGCETCSLSLSSARSKFALDDSRGRIPVLPLENPPPDKENHYYALIYERGCGITKACGTGAAAVTQTLYQQNKILCNQKISIQMPGGVLQTYLDSDESIIQIAHVN